MAIDSLLAYKQQRLAAMREMYAEEEKSSNPLSSDTVSCNNYSIPKYEDLGVFTSSVKNNSKYNDAYGKQTLDKNTYYIRMPYYFESEEWADKMIEETYKLSDMISDNVDFDNILSEAESAIRIINDDQTFGVRKKYPSIFAVPYIGRGMNYFGIYNDLFNPSDDDLKLKRTNKSNSEYSNANTASIVYDKYSGVSVEYGFGKETNLDLVKQEYNKLKSINNPTEEQIMNSVATIHWLIAQESPYIHGNDSVANLLTKAIMHSYGIEVSQIKKGHSFDFEAFYRDLDNFIQIYPDLFELPPKKSN